MFLARIFTGMDVILFYDFLHWRMHVAGHTISIEEVYFGGDDVVPRGGKVTVRQ